MKLAPAPTEHLSSGYDSIGEMLGDRSGLPDQQQKLILPPLARAAPTADEANLAAYDNDLTSKRSKKRRNRTYSKALELALEKAKQLHMSLSTEHPSFIKQIQWSHVNLIYKLGVPVEFCKSHLPTHHEDVTLEDESGECYKVRFLAGTEGRFLKGWKKFSVDHNQLEGDVVVFHMLKPYYYKVYILRANHPNEVHNIHTNEGQKKRRCEVAHRNKELALVEAIQESSAKSPLLSSSDLAPASSHSVRNDLQISYIACQLSGSDADFENFKITVKVEIIDSELPRATRLQYYHLCCSWGSYPHEKVDRTLAASFIKATLKVANAIRGFRINTAKDDFAMWGDTLEAFQMLGMEVGFLSERLKRLVRLRSEFGENEELMRFKEAKKKRDRIVEEIRSIEEKLLGIKEATEKVEDDMKKMEVDFLKYKDTFLQEANDPR